MVGFLLYFTACVAAAPDTCEAGRLILDVADASACASIAQPNLARWIAAHPAYRITGWRCGAPVRASGTRI